MRQLQALRLLLAECVSPELAQLPRLMPRISSTPSPMLPLIMSDVGTHILNQAFQSNRNQGHLSMDSLPHCVKSFIIGTARIGPI